MFFLFVFVCLFGSLFLFLLVRREEAMLTLKSRVSCFFVCFCVSVWFFVFVFAC